MAKRGRFGDRFYGRFHSATLLACRPAGNTRGRDSTIFDIHADSTATVPESRNETEVGAVVTKAPTCRFRREKSTCSADVSIHSTYHSICPESKKPDKCCDSSNLTGGGFRKLFHLLQPNRLAPSVPRTLTKCSTPPRPPGKPHPASAPAPTPGSPTSAEPTGRPPHRPVKYARGASIERASFSL